MTIIDARADDRDGKAIRCDHGRNTSDQCTVTLVPGERSTPPGPWDTDHAIEAACDAGWIIDIFTPGTDKCPDHALAAITPLAPWRWPSGVAAQCESCGQTTVVRGFGDDMLGDPSVYMVQAVLDRRRRRGRCAMTAVKGPVVLHCDTCPNTTTYGLTTVSPTRVKAQKFGWRVPWQGDPRATASADPRRPDICPECWAKRALR